MVNESNMAVQQNRKTRSKRGMRRSHDALGGPTLTVDSTSGETRVVVTTLVQMAFTKAKKS